LNKTRNVVNAQVRVQTFKRAHVCVDLCVRTHQVTRHLLKLFDNIADLRFKDPELGGGGGGDGDGKAVAMGMYSREGEYVAFSEPCVCEGQV